MLQAFLFDIDGTLIDTVDLHTQAWDDTLRHFGYNFEYDRIRSQIGKGGDQLLPELLPKDEAKRREKEITEYRADLFKRKYLDQVRPFPQVRDLFQRLRNDGKRTALASSSKKDELEHYVELMNIKDLVEAKVSGDDAERSKPHPDIFHAALDKLSITGEQCRAIGDSPYDAEAAGKAGVKTIGVRSGNFPDEWLREAGCIALYQDPSDLLAHYKEWTVDRQ